jgi:deoxycytidylate deaminase
LLRNAQSLLETPDEILAKDLEKDYINQNPDLRAFTPFEKTNKKFQMVLHSNFDDKIRTNGSHLKGRNICYCFKSIHNSYVDGKNQVHTRSLHAEESAFLQISKYGGTGILGGKLFTTASPCEICAKKAYQLGIKVIYYVDPYPGISNEQIFNVGSNKPEVRLFNGAIGNAYHWLYEPLMSYKEELSLILDLDIQDLIKIKDKKIIENKIKIDALEMENQRLNRALNEKANLLTSTNEKE